MSLPTPNLDDRTWEDIVEEAKKLIAGFCPQWTDFNPSDPGIVLVELMAWMTEMIIYRLNRVPDKNYVKFMELMGIRLKTPNPASTWLVFDTVQGADETLLGEVPENTRVSGFDSDENTVTFETVEPMNLNHARLTHVFARINERYKDNTEEILSRDTSTAIHLFDVRDEVPHALYLSDPDMAKAGNDFYFCISTRLDIAVPPLHVKWSYWDGQEWRPVVPERDETVGFSKSGALKFPQMPELSEREFQGHTGYWLRVELTSYRGEPLPRFEEFKKVMEIKREAGVIPDTGFFSSTDVPFLPVMFEAPVMPFGREAKPGDSLCIGSDVFARKGEPVTIQIRLSDTYKPTSGIELTNLRISWDYYTMVGEWTNLGISSPQGTLQSSESFVDRTEAFTKSGAVTFRVPADIGPLEVGGEEKYWLRITVIAGDYGEKKKLNPPVCGQILIRYKDKPADFQHYIAYNDFIYEYITPFQEPDALFEPFIAVSRKNPDLFLAFDHPFSNKLHNIYFPVEGTYDKDKVVRCEYSHSEGWKTLHLVKDDTENLTRRGLVKLMGPTDWTAHSQFGHEAFWLRVRWIENPGPQLPMLKSIHLNTVKAINAVSHRDEILGSGNGQPFQRFTFQNFPVQPGPIILVRELESNIQEEIDNYKKRVKEYKVVEQKDPGTGEVIALWVRWEEQENFFHSKRDSRHYILDVRKGTITFGDGIRGAIPLTGKQNIASAIYYTGGGKAGNMGRHTITNMEGSIPYVDRVTNYYPAVGGTDAETLEEAKLRAPRELKHNHRAVTMDDFKHFAMAASGEVARVNVRTDDQGTIVIMIVPHSVEGDEGKPTASQELCREVEQYIDRHRLITTRVRISGPVYVDFTLHGEVVLLPRAAHQAQQKRQEIVDAVRGFFHPLTGEQEGTGWPVGRSVYISELYNIIENIPGVDFVSTLTLNNQPGRQRIKIPENACPYPKEVVITFVTT
jgi:hypothetical protein